MLIVITYFISAPLILAPWSLVIHVTFSYMTIDVVNLWFSLNCDSFLPSPPMKTKFSVESLK
jgi:hypothetical protein